ncbi:MAG: hypothetical protein ACM37W_11360 [Actinomycetota bacterium]
MFSQIFYLVRSKTDGQYLVARPNQDSGASYLLMFREDSEALSYLNKYGEDVADRFGLESISGSQLSALIKRWGFTGVGIVQDPLLPRIEFLIVS